MCVLCDLPPGRINEILYGHPTGSWVILDWSSTAGQGDIIIGVFRNTEITRATTEPTGHGVYEAAYADQYFEQIMDCLQEQGQIMYGTGSWGYIVHDPGDFELSNADYEHIPKGSWKKSGKNNGIDKRLKRKPTKLEAKDHWYVELIQSGSVWDAEDAQGAGGGQGNNP